MKNDDDIIGYDGIMVSDSDFGSIDDGTWEFSRDKMFNDLQIVLRVNANVVIKRSSS
jgi:hypothetical protein